MRDRPAGQVLALETMAALMMETAAVATGEDSLQHASLVPWVTACISPVAGAELAPALADAALEAVAHASAAASSIPASAGRAPAHPESRACRAAASGAGVRAATNSPLGVPAAHAPSYAAADLAERLGD